MLGSTSEMLIFPILEIVNKEVQKALNGTQLAKLIESVNNSTGSGYISDPGEGNNNIVYDKNVLNALESNDYEVTFEHKDPSNPKLLTAVVLMFGQFLKEKVNLIRTGSKLTSVKIVVMKIEPISEITPNPYGMSGLDFAEYVRNKRKWEYYMHIQADTSNSQEVRDNAKQQMNYAEIRNEELRNVYMIDPLSDLPYDELLKYLQNPLAMDKTDFVLYMRNLRIALKEHPDVTTAMVTKASDDNKKLRARYFIEEDDNTYTYKELKKFLPNPPGFTDEDFVTYVTNKENYIKLNTVTVPDLEAKIAAETDPVKLVDLQKELDAAKAQMQQIVEENVGLRNDNFALIDSPTTGWDDSLDKLKPYLPKPADVYSEKVLFNILISLIYDSNGKLDKVTSVTGVN
jgi:hypothetical protein